MNVISYTYDANGNTASKTAAGVTRTCHYDRDNRLIRVSEGEGDEEIFTAVYDYRSRRLEKTENGDTVSYLYDGGVSVQEYDAEGSLKTYLVRAGGYGGGIGDVVYTENADGTGREYFLYNATGTTSALTDDDDAVTSTSCYTAWGIETATVGTSENVRKFSTKERSELLGIDYFGFRCYDPDLGRFLTRDPSGYPDGPNNYLYCMNSPVNKIGPLGVKSQRGGYLDWFIAPDSDSLSKSSIDPLNVDSSRVVKSGFTDMPDKDLLDEMQRSFANMAGDAVYRPTIVDRLKGRTNLGNTSTQSLGSLSEMAEKLFQSIFDPIGNLKKTIGHDERVERMTQRIVAGQKHGESINQASVAATLISMGDMAGTSQMNQAIRGIDLATGQPLDRNQRLHNVGYGIFGITTTWGTYMVGSTPRLVIGRMDDIKYLYRAEYTLPGQNRLPNLGNPKANWIQNSMELRRDMGLRRPIRDASLPDSTPAPTKLFQERTIRQTFTGAERNTLRNRGWTFDEKSKLWFPPK